jgi:prepilin-type N-terminal cleavage/methylation domain-containing protein
MSGERILPRRGDPATCAGFTLIELVMVLTVVGLIAAVAFPRIDIAQYRINGAAKALGSTLLSAQRAALSRQHDVVVMFDQSQPALRVLEDQDNDGTVDNGERVRVVPLGEQVVFGRGSAPARPMGSQAIVIQRTVGGMPALIFHRNGSASEAGGFYVTSQREANSGGHPGDSRAVEVERATGRASWYRYRGNAWVRDF